MTKYRIKFQFVGRAGICYFNLEKSNDDWQTYIVIVRNDTASSCKTILKEILEGEQEVMVVPVNVHVTTYA